MPTIFNGITISGGVTFAPGPFGFSVPAVLNGANSTVYLDGVTVNSAGQFASVGYSSPDAFALAAYSVL